MKTIKQVGSIDNFSVWYTRSDCFETWPGSTNPIIICVLPQPFPAEAGILTSVMTTSFYVKHNSQVIKYPIRQNSPDQQWGLPRFLWGLLSFLWGLPRFQWGLPRFLWGLHRFQWGLPMFQWGLPRFLLDVYRGTFSEVKWPGSDVIHRRGYEWVELCLYSHSMPAWLGSASSLTAPINKMNSRPLRRRRVLFVSLFSECDYSLFEAP